MLHIKDQCGQSGAICLEKCSLCGTEGRKKCSGCESVYYCSRRHQLEDWLVHKNKCGLWKIENGEGEEDIMKATRDIPANSILFVEYPVLTYVSHDSNSDIQSLPHRPIFICAGCERRTHDKGSFCRCLSCGIPLCSSKCKMTPRHRLYCAALQVLKIVETRDIEDFETIHEDLAVLGLLQKVSCGHCELNRIWRNSRSQSCYHLIKSFLLNNSNSNRLQATFPLSLRACNGDANLVIRLYAALKSLSLSQILEARPGAGAWRKILYERICSVSHDCAANTELLIDESNHYKLTVRSRVLIAAGSKVTCSVIPIKFPTVMRQKYLKRLFINCHCLRCRDPTELQSHIQTVICPKCRVGSTVPEEALKSWSNLWRCDSCRHAVKGATVDKIVRSVGDKLSSLTSTKSRNKIKICDALNRLLLENKGSVLHPRHYLIQETTHFQADSVREFAGEGAELVLFVVGKQSRAFFHSCSELSDAFMYLNLEESVCRGLSMNKAKCSWRIAVVKFAHAIHKLINYKTPGPDYMDEMSSCLHFLRACYENAENSPCFLRGSWYEDARDLEKLIRVLHADYLKRDSPVDYSPILKSLRIAVQVWSCNLLWVKSCDHLGSDELAVPNKISFRHFLTTLCFL